MSDKLKIEDLGYLADQIHDALVYLADKNKEGLDNIASQIKYLGNGDATTTMGAIEYLAKTIKDCYDEYEMALERIKTSIPDPE